MFTKNFQEETANSKRSPQFIKNGYVIFSSETSQYVYDVGKCLCTLSYGKI